MLGQFPTISKEGNRGVIVNCSSRIRRKRGQGRGIMRDTEGAGRRREKARGGGITAEHFIEKVVPV